MPSEFVAWQRLWQDLDGLTKRISAAKPATKMPEQDRVQEFSKLINIVFPKDEYAYTLAEAAKGVKLDYKIVIQEDVKDVIPLRFEPSYSEPPGPSGLFPREQISGMGQTYCLCDFGNVPVPPKEVVATLKKGEYAHTFEWDGRNWQGPSDTSTPRGKPFPAGTYDVTVTIHGKLVTDKGAVPYRIAGRSKLVLK